MFSNGWKSLQWAVVSAIVLGSLTGGVTLWRQMLLTQERLEVLVAMNAKQNELLHRGQEVRHVLEQQIALLQHTDAKIIEELKEHLSFFHDLWPRLRSLEQRRESGGKP